MTLMQSKSFLVRKRIFLKIFINHILACLFLRLSSYVGSFCISVVCVFKLQTRLEIQEGIMLYLLQKPVKCSVFFFCRKKNRSWSIWFFLISWNVFVILWFVNQWIGVVVESFRTCLYPQIYIFFPSELPKIKKKLSINHLEKCYRLSSLIYMNLFYRQARLSTYCGHLVRVAEFVSTLWRYVWRFESCYRWCWQSIRNCSHNLQVILDIVSRYTSWSTLSSSSASGTLLTERRQTLRCRRFRLWMTV